jgi:hypothetical protein
METEFPPINKNTRALDRVRYPDSELKARRIARYTMDLIKGGVYFEVYNVEQYEHGDTRVEDVSEFPDTDKKEDKTEEQRDLGTNLL